jgi:hypothetical protein
VQLQQKVSLVFLVVLLRTEQADDCIVHNVGQKSDQSKKSNLKGAVVHLLTEMFAPWVALTDAF